ncbi:AcrR family transcriptional regulator [Actinoplanes tereljensis]|nr:TetR/AcrR family transcriptional regulator C-terminal domain-containing protein [Actinoplanes tereljensis]
MSESRRRGRPPRIDRDRIVAAARDMDPATLTMQAVAERLGVDRKALNYHVTDRDGLLQLVAHETLSSLLETVTPVDGTWQDMVRAIAHQTRASMIAVGAHFDYVRLPIGSGPAALAPNEHLLRSLVEAGFTDAQAGRALGLLAELMYASARNTVLAGRYGEHPQITELNRMLAEAPPGTLPSIRRLSAARIGLDPEQFDFDLDVVIAGLAQLLDR